MRKEQLREQVDNLRGVLTAVLLKAGPVTLTHEEARTDHFSVSLVIEDLPDGGMRLSILEGANPAGRSSPR